MKYTVIFPGQGAQRPGMGQAFTEKYKVSKDVFAEADEALGFSISNTIFNGTPEELAKTAITQPAILTTSIAILRAMEAEFGAKLAPCCTAGHSLGEYTALVATGALSLADGVRLVRLRGQLMQDAVPIGEGTMAAVIGLDLDEIKKICAEAAEGEVCEAANVNQPLQIVISGHTGAVKRAEKIIEGLGTAKVVPLRVSAPFHCVLMRPVADKLKEAFVEIEWHDPEYPIVTNADAKMVSKADEMREALYKQTFSPVLWAQSVLEMEKFGTDGYIELGPGSVLSGLVRKICKGKRPFPVSAPEDMEPALAFLRGEKTE